MTPLHLSFFLYSSLFHVYEYMQLLLLVLLWSVYYVGLSYWTGAGPESFFSSPTPSVYLSPQSVMHYGYLQLGFDQSTCGFKTNRRLGVNGGVLTEFSGKHIQSNTEANAFVCPVGLSPPSQQIESGRMEWTNVFWL